MRWAKLCLAGLAWLPYALMAFPGRQANKLDSADLFTPAFTVLHAHCSTCHSGANPPAKLDLSTPAGIAKGGVSGKLIVPGHSKDSLLIHRLMGLDGKEQMPMGFKPLGADSMDALTKWIDSGGKITKPKEHWAFIVPSRPRLPVVSHPGWCRNEIDRFVLAGLDKEGLRPSPEARKETLIRRASLDLIGLPPTPAQVQEFLGDRSPNAYEKLVDRLLASPHYGERMARPWLDLARYADTNGYEADRSRSMWPYRDWVIKAFNENMSYREFTKDQIAGDMIPNPTTDDKIASGFNCNVMVNEEGGVDQGEQRWLRLCDMAATTAQTWLGVTLQCATCHDHKYDPFTQADFYKFVAFFESSYTPELELNQALAPKRKLAQDHVNEVQAAIDALPKGSPQLAGKLVELQEAKDSLALLNGPFTMIMQERPGLVPWTYIRKRGSYLNPGDRVDADIPKIFNALPPNVPHNRLGLAQWLTSDRNPLSARVQVNRMWELFFGRGIVETSENFGTQGTPPSNPDLLDWLATEFMRRGWDMKAINRLIVTSATYRQSSNATPELLRRDPQNVLLARGPRFRMEAEMIRDNALMAAGLLNLKMNGPSVMPYEPDGIWDSPYSDEKWTNAADSNRYRRGIYTFWKRTAPYPSFVALDATSRESCTVRRVLSNTPLQALDLLNDTAYVEAAQALARRMESAGALPAARLGYGFRLCLVRAPKPPELARLESLYAKLKLDYDAKPEDAKKLAGSPDLAALTMVANVLLNLDETITKR